MSGRRPSYSTARSRGAERSRSRRAPSAVGPVRRVPTDERRADTGRHDHAPGAQTDPHRVVKRREHLGQPGLPQPMVQVQGVAAGDQQHIGLPDQRDPALGVDARQRRQFQYAQRLPAQLGHAFFRPAADEIPGLLARTDPRVSVHRGRDAQRAAVLDRLAQLVEQCPTDARVLDARGRERSLNAASWCWSVPTVGRHGDSRIDRSGRQKSSVDPADPARGAPADVRASGPPSPERHCIGGCTLP